MLNHKSRKIFTFLCFIGLFAGLEAKRSSESVFTEIYQDRVWGVNSEGEGTSGFGSLLETTEIYRLFLQDFLHHYNIQSVVDVGCGDWSFSHAINWEGIAYTGFDVVKSVIEKNQEKFGASNIQFVHVDALATDLPSADLLICKDVMQHLPNADILSFIPQLKKYKYCLITNDIDPHTFTSQNFDISEAGGWRTLDLTEAPFHLKGSKILTYQTIDNCEIKQVLLIENK